MRSSTTRTVISLGAALGLAATLSACGALGGSQVATADLGACLVLDELGSGSVTEIPTVDCSEEHDGQIVGKFDLDDGDYPGDQAIQDGAAEGCLSAFASFVGIDYADSALMMQPIYPTQETWEQANDREILCVAYLTDGMTTESFEGSAQ